MYLALRQRQTRFFRCCRERSFTVLRRHPDFAAVGIDQRGAVGRLHRRVPEEGRAVDRIDALDCAGNRLQSLALSAQGKSFVSAKAFLQTGINGGARLRRVRAFVPLDRQGVERLLGAPPGVGHHSDRAAIDLHRALDPRHAENLVTIKTLERPAIHRAAHHRGVQHAGQLEVDAVNLGTIELVGCVQALDRLAGDLPLLWALELDALGIRRGELGSSSGHLAVSGFAFRRSVADDALVHTDLTGRHLPAISGGLQQHDARSRAATAHIVFRDADAAAATGAHLAPDAIARKVLARRRHFGGDVLPVALEFFSHQLRQASERALAHLGARDTDHTGLVRFDDDPGVDFRNSRRALGGSEGRQIEAKREPGSSRGGANDEIAARGAFYRTDGADRSNGFFHGDLP